ncbi:MAG: hypothetical protein HQL96_17050, partial [Magnetococcales bacterium]|nr:hypothetical protein [Magnetococcales bacterium]
MKKLTIGFKLAFGFGLVLLLTILVAFTAYMGFIGVKQRMDVNQEMESLMEHLSIVIQSEKNLIIRKDAKYIAENHEAREAIRKQVTLDRDQKLQDADEKKEMDEILAATDNYGKEFSQFTGSMEKFNEGLARVREVAHEMQNAAQALQTDQVKKMKELLAKVIEQEGSITDKATLAEKLTNVEKRVSKVDAIASMVTAFKDARIGEKEIIISQGKDEKHITRNQVGVNLALKTAKELLPTFTAQLNIDQIQQIIRSLESYQKEMAHFLDLFKEQARQEKEMVEARRKADKQINATLHNQQAHADRLITTSMKTILIASGVAVLLGGLIAWLITRSIRKPLGGEPQAMADVVQAVAEGDLSLE